MIASRIGLAVESRICGHAPECDRFAAARALMCESARLYLGVLALPILDEIDRCDSYRLRSIVTQWYLGLCESEKLGPHLAKEYLAAVRQLLHLAE